MLEVYKWDTARMVGKDVAALSWVSEHLLARLNESLNETEEVGEGRRKRREKERDD